MVEGRSYWSIAGCDWRMVPAISQSWWSSSPRLNLKPTASSTHVRRTTILFIFISVLNIFVCVDVCAAGVFLFPYFFIYTMMWQETFIISNILSLLINSVCLQCQWLFVPDWSWSKLQIEQTAVSTWQIQHTHRCTAQVRDTSISLTTVFKYLLLTVFSVITSSVYPLTHWLTKLCPGSWLVNWQVWATTQRWATVRCGRCDTSCSGWGVRMTLRCWAGLWLEDSSSTRILPSPWKRSWKTGEVSCVSLHLLSSVSL